MELKFCVENGDILRSPYYNDFFFEKIKICVKTEKYEKTKLFHSALHGRFLLNLGEAIIELLKTGKEQTVKSIGEPHLYKISLQSDEIIIKSIEKQEVIQKFNCSREDFLNALAIESKHYLQSIKKVNPRIVLEDQYQLLASCYVFFDSSPIFEFNS
ncbi:MAG TPA: hypothetical protein VNU45_19850 [Rummeliibacillus sp.]|nr:hypothetical protein [Rummeliibacillus sp.]